MFFYHTKTQEYRFKYLILHSAITAATVGHDMA